MGQKRPQGAFSRFTKASGYPQEAASRHYYAYSFLVKRFLLSFDRFKRFSGGTGENTSSKKPRAPVINRKTTAQNRPGP
jgi:hypothetical protein